jgi:hypothetical protein
VLPVSAACEWWLRVMTASDDCEWWLWVMTASAVRHLNTHCTCATGSTHQHNVIITHTAHINYRHDKQAPNCVCCRNCKRLISLTRPHHKLPSPPRSHFPSTASLNHPHHCHLLRHHSPHSSPSPLSTLTTGTFINLQDFWSAVTLNGHQTKLENDDTGILHEADVGDTYNALGVQFTVPSSNCAMRP